VRLLFQRLYPLAFVCAVLLAVSARAAPQAIEIAILDNAAMGPVALAVLREAYGRLGVDIRTRTLPLRRGIQMADQGEVDGDLMHSLPALKEWPHLTVVKVPVVRAVFVAYKQGTACPDVVPARELAATRIAYMRGTVAVEEALPKEALLATTNNLDAFKHLQHGIVQYAVVGRLEGDSLLASHPMGNICKVATPVVTSDLFHSLNSRHAELAARVERVLQEMSDSGEIKRIWSREIQRLRSQAGPKQR